ncbi:bifunctional DNA-formamidopyrimidine glycosylase/DNA-(apurinic or apyrimidinic site) lyase [Halochromatium roseum]|uniref:bifunctional DNA-formamidopyrimidine glycosylase/DNA-(apurinic or apyrimidinic site) lyase n=1 Tax=Halochromatium roseum TaxID=391920 RepID=UPI0019120F8A|nr:bifunctional DNA-formamidopyrimidine glycosylase/DNA-(apurinic or apyrimidinic site) lyase [Halochromatium roseum]MBK5940258.1 DNA-formamidopyrimidine glycosylase [Halochromatium roseum]
MPELPEVETSLRGIAPHLVGRRIARLVVRDHRLRWPIPVDTAERLADQIIVALRRRGKYLLFDLKEGVLLLHLGMSGSLRVLSATTMPGRHDHVDLCLEDGQCLRFRDPRRFGMLQWTPAPAEAHPLLRDLGPEPLGPAFSGDYLFQRSRGRRAPIKTFIMDSQVVVGVGNIYANESLHLARIHPNRAAGRISRERLDRLAGAIRSVLADAIAQGGTSLRDFVQEDGNPGYFAQSLRVYGRTEQPCPSCGSPIRQCRIGQRSSFYCAVCQH